VEDLFGRETIVHRRKLRHDAADTRHGSWNRPPLAGGRFQGIRDAVPILVDLLDIVNHVDPCQAEDARVIRN
jgi:hypothetical protein